MGGLVKVVPAGVPAMTQEEAAQAEDVLGPGFGPEHAGLFETLADHGLAAGFDDAKADKQVWVTKLGVAHAFGISLQVGGFDAKLLDDFGIG